MIISHVKIIVFQLSLFCKNYRFSKTVLYIINRKIHGCLEIPDLFIVLNMVSRVLATVKNSALNAVFPITLRSQFPNLGQPKNSYRNSMLLIRHLKFFL